jgi:xanthine dehydrogenase molybdenum-binding subunit
MRGIGNIQFNFLLGQGIDVLAERLGMDPIDLVVKNFGDHLPMPNESIAAVLLEGAQRIGWKEKRHLPGKGETVSGSKKRGIGFSFHNEWHALWQEKRRGLITIGIKINPDGTVFLDAPTIETGPGTNSVAVHLCAEALGVPVEHISWLSTVDTDRSPKDQVQTDSAVSIIFAEAIAEAAQEAKKNLLSLAAPLLSAPIEELEFRNGSIFNRTSPEKTICIREILEKGDMVPLVTVHNYEIPVIDTGIPFRASFAEVEVDMETGELEIIKLIVLDDMGTVLSPAGAEGQAIGGQCQGLGETLTEYTIYDEQSGKPLNFNWIDYPIQTLADFPDIEPVPMEVWKGSGEYGASGMGEGVMTCTPRAIANAVYNAVGVRINDLPITLPKLQEALHRNTAGT